MYKWNSSKIYADNKMRNKYSWIVNEAHNIIPI